MKIPKANQSDDICMLVSGELVFRIDILHVPFFLVLTNVNDKMRLQFLQFLDGSFRKHASFFNKCKNLTLEGFISHFETSIHLSNEFYCVFVFAHVLLVIKCRCSISLGNVS